MDEDEKVKAMKRDLRTKLKAVNRKLERFNPKVLQRRESQQSKVEAAAFSPTGSDDEKRVLHITDLRRFYREVRKRAKRWQTAQEQAYRERLEDHYLPTKEREIEEVERKCPGNSHAHRAERERLVNLISNNIERRIAVEIEKRRLEDWSERRALTFAKAECRKVLWEEFQEMKLEYLAELERLQGQDQGAAGNEASEEPGELRDLRGLQGDKGRQGRRESLFHGRALHAGDGDGGVGALGTLAGSALDYDGEGLPDDPEAPDGGMGDDLDEGHANVDSRQGAVTPQSRQGSRDVRLTLFQRREFLRALENPAEEIGSLAAITHLSLAHCSLKRKAVIALAAEIGSFPLLKLLDMKGNDLGCNSTGVLLEALSAHPSIPLAAVDLSSNSIGCGSQQGVEAVRDFVVREAGIQRLKSLNLRSNFLGENVNVVMAAFLQHKDGPVEELNLADNGIQGAGVTAIAEALKLNHVIQELNLAHNRIGADGAVIIGQLACESQLLRLNLEWNPLYDQGVEELSKLLPLSSLQEVNIGSTKMKDRGAFELYNNLMPASSLTLKILDVSHCLLSSEALRLVREMTKEHGISLRRHGMTSLRGARRQLPDISGGENAAKKAPGGAKDGTATGGPVPETSSEAGPVSEAPSRRASEARSPET